MRKRLIILSLSALVWQMNNSPDTLNEALFWLIREDGDDLDLKNYSSMVDEYIRSAQNVGVIRADDVMKVIRKAIADNRLTWRPIGEYKTPQLSDLLVSHGLNPVVGTAFRYGQIRKLIVSANDGVEVHF